MNNGFPEQAGGFDLSGFEFSDRIEAILLLQDAEFEAQLLAIKGALHRNQETEAQTAKEIKELEQRVHAYRGGDQEFEIHLQDYWVDEMHRSAYQDAAHSMAAVGMMLVRRLVHGMGYRYRLHAKELPGRSDLVFRPRRCVIFVHGCFWHRHEGCPANRMPKTRREFWRRKLNGNVQRDRRNKEKLERTGWRVLTLWECETKDLRGIATAVTRFLGPAGSVASATGPGDERRPFALRKEHDSS